MDSSTQDKLRAFANALINQENARVVVPPRKNAPGYWFGGGSMLRDDDGTLYLSGRYRNYGDSREGLAKGERGLELAIFRSTDGGKEFTRVKSFTKQDLSRHGQVYSIEGSALHRTDSGEIELYISTEKAIPYPVGFEEFLKPGTGVWSIDRIRASSIEALDADRIEPILNSDDPVSLHIKDPFIYENREGDTILGFCTHPFGWSSSNTGYALRKKGQEDFGLPKFNIIPKGQTWDVSMARATWFLDIRGIGSFPDDSGVVMVFYDSAECLRNHEEHASAKSRPRGYSCEELGGCGYFENDDFREFHRLSDLFPMFVSPMGTGSSRYVSVLECKEGFYANWQQSQTDLSQPTVLNFLSRKDAERLLT